MGDPSPYQYTYKDIESYHSGAMPPDEMHKMEMAALDDPFLADALEGYINTSTAKADLEKLNEQLNERTKRRAKVLWIRKKSNALKVAVVLLFVIAGSWLLVVSKQNSSNELALDNKTNSIRNNVSKTGQDSTQVNKKNDSIIEYKNEPTIASSEPKKKLKQPIKNQSSEKDVAVVTPKINSESSQPSLNTPIKDNASTVQIAPESRIGAAKAFKAESNQYKDTSAKVDGYASKATKQLSDTIKNVDVVLKPQAVPNLSEVVVTKARANRKASRSPFVIADTLEPEEGWDEYNDYIANNLKSPEEAKVKSLTGEVELSFDVNRNGHPINIKVEKSLCDPCDTEAIRLLKEGPKWKKKKNKKGKLRIRF